MSQLPVIMPKFTVAGHKENPLSSITAFFLKWKYVHVLTKKQ